MKNIEEINKTIVKKILTKKKIPEFFAGDTVKVGVRIVEGKRERIQYFEGVCIAKKNRDINSSFTVRKISFGEGVERTFALYSPIIGSIKIIRSGKVKKGEVEPLPRKQTYEEMKKNLLICPLNEMIDKLGVYAEAGVDEIIVSSSFGQNQKDLTDSMYRMSEEVIPYFKKNNVQVA